MNSCWINPLIGTFLHPSFEIVKLSCSSVIVELVHRFLHVISLMPAGQQLSNAVRMQLVVTAINPLVM